jgi:hypothetical protein
VIRIQWRLLERHDPAPAHLAFTQSSIRNFALGGEAETTGGGNNGRTMAPSAYSIAPPRHGTDRFPERDEFRGRLISGRARLGGRYHEDVPFGLVGWQIEIGESADAQEAKVAHPEEELNLAWEEEPHPMFLLRFTG